MHRTRCFRQLHEHHVRDRLLVREHHETTGSLTTCRDQDDDLQGHELDLLDELLDHVQHHESGFGPSSNDEDDGLHDHELDLLLAAVVWPIST